MRKPDAVCRLEPRGNGWCLTLAFGDEEVLDWVYGRAYHTLNVGEDVFAQSQPFEQARHEVEQFAKSQHGHATVNARSHLVSLWLPKKQIPLRWEEVTVDLKWSLWSPWQTHWEDYAPGVWDRLRSAFYGTGPGLKVHTAPRKEIRFGQVEVSKGTAEVEFHSHWDAPYEQVPDDIPEGDRELAEKIIAEYFELGDGFCEGDTDDPIGAQAAATVRARTFDRLMAKIDDVENVLLHEEKVHSGEFDAFLKTLPAQIAARREGQGVDWDNLGGEP